MTTKPQMERRYHFEHRIPVRDYEVDVQGIVNNANYLHYMEITRHEFCREAGMSFPAMHAMGIDPVLRSVNIEYLTPLRPGQEMVSKLRIRRDGARFIFDQDIYRLPDGEPVTRATVTVVCLENGRLSRGEVLAEAFADFLNDNV